MFNQDVGSSQIQEMFQVKFTQNEQVVNNLPQGYALKNDLINILHHPLVSSTLLFLMIAGIIYELQAPGVGVPLVISIVTGCLFFYPLYAKGYVSSWEVILLLVGIRLIVFEVFVTPGVGIAGIIGFLAMVVALTMSFIDNSTIEFTAEGMSVFTEPLIRVLIPLFFATLFLFVATPAIFKSKSKRSITLHTEASSEEGFTVLENQLKDKVGQIATVVTELKPMGKVQISNEVYTARSVVGWVEKGEQVEVIQLDVNNLVVRKLEKI